MLSRQNNYVNERRNNIEMRTKRFVKCEAVPNETLNIFFFFFFREYVIHERLVENANIITLAYLRRVIPKVAILPGLQLANRVFAKRVKRFYVRTQ